MDQIKVFLAWLKAQHFWVLTIFAIVLGLGVWQQGSAHLASETRTNKGTIEGEFQSTGRISSMPFHPNDDVNVSQSEQNRLLAAKVRHAWQTLYDRQTTEVLQWPPQLGREFSRVVSRLSFGSEINMLLRDRYLNYIQRRFRDLPKIIDAPEIPADGSLRRGGGGLGRGRGGEFGGGEFGGGGRGGAMASNEELDSQDFMCLWHDQLEVRSQLAWEQRPSSLAIWVTQEDLWVYETLLKAIAATNEASRADRYSNAAVRDIFALQVGRAVKRSTKSAGRIYTPQDTATGGMGGEFGGRGGDFGGMGGELGGMGGEFGGGRDDFGGMGGEFDGRGGEGGDEKTLLLAGRYVDEMGQPMPTPLDNEFSFGTEYKRLPVRLVLKLDQRWLNQLIIELANAPLQVEVQEVRINPTEDMGMSGGSRGGYGRGGGQSEVMAFDREPHVRQQVVLEGLVYIFYPPNDSVLEVPGDDTELAGM